MPKFIRCAALLTLVVLLGITMVGCSGTTSYVPGPVVPGPVPNPVPNPGPTPGPAKAPMGAFIEQVVAFTTNNRNMYVATNDGTGLTKLNSQLRDFNSVYVLPDGSRGVFTAQDVNNGYSQIYYLASLDGATQPIQLTNTPVHKTSAMLSADSNRIIFLQLNPLGETPDGLDVWDIGVIDVNGSSLNLISRPQGWYFSHPFLSPDGSTIAVALSQGFFGGDMGIFVMSIDGSGLKRLTPSGVNGILGVAPAFSSDGSRIVFSSVGWNDLSIYIVNIDGSGLQCVGGHNSGAGDPLLVGDRIMFVKGSDIYSMRADGGDLRQVTKNTVEDAFDMKID